jgi:hypothetical protein
VDLLLDLLERVLGAVEMPGRSVGPTASESMLKPRRANIDVMRVSAPGLSSTWTEIVCFTALPPS